MRIIRSKKEMSAISRQIRRQEKTLGFVPTMGALHQGHLSLIQRAREETDFLVVSIFLNPIQFGPEEDFKRYPRVFKRDARLCRREGADVVFYPKADDMYPADFKTSVSVSELSQVLCGRFRPGHFQGVATVVAKLFNIVSPDIAYFGQKDAQQAIIIKKMAWDLNMPVKIKVVSTVRQNDGLALSSRNIYLKPKERKDATVLYQALNLARHLIKQGNVSARDIVRRMKQLINKKKTAVVQYISIVDLKDLRPVDKIKGKVLIALAVWVGKTRLIDNIIVNV
ncbi:MAG: pantoate--beta-alanine ligase [Candidatus Omnitrophica bacterium]|nr:pantoate--beta-alanine ligase [Candidatus Omnitrophota bacterium]